MAKTPSSSAQPAAKSPKPVTKSAKSPKPVTKSPKSPKSAPKSPQPAQLPRDHFAPFRNLARKIRRTFQSLKAHRAAHPPLHRSFRRSYREDYQRPVKTPGLLHHAITTFQILFQHWRTFLPFIAIMVGLYILTVGLLSEDLYQQFNDAIDSSATELANGEIGNFARAALLLVSSVTTGGLSTGMSEVQVVFMVALFLIMWLVTIFLLRHFFAGEHPRLRDGLYNALAPLLSTFLIFALVFVQAIPIMLVVITLSAAQLTNFLSTPFYALVYFIFAALMLLLSGYLLSSSLIALIAVTSPGIYPLKALFAASDLIAGRRLKLITRLLYLIFVVCLIYIITMLPIILIDLGLKNLLPALAGIPIVPFFLLVVTCFVFIYATTYLYRYYRWLLDYQEK